MDVSFTRKPLPPGCQRFTYYELRGATSDFCRRALVGEGGFGKVYRGTLEDGTLVAIKCLDRKGLQGDKEFNVEVSTLARLRHPNLVTLLGACTESSHRLAVFDFMPGGSLRDQLDLRDESGQLRSHARLSWQSRICIAIGAAQGLCFLHEGTHPGLIHRDVKSSNVLLDSQGQARIADFGLALYTGRCSGQDAAGFEINAANDADVLTGTYGYSAPECSYGRIGQKSDVFSFGVILLELLVGQKPVDTSRPVGSQMLVDEMLPILQTNSNIQDLQDKLDPDLPAASVPAVELAWFSEIAYSCLQTNPKDRPRMSKVVRLLESVQRLKESAPALPPKGEQTLRSLMNAMAVEPNGNATDPAPLVDLQDPFPGAYCTQPASLPLEERIRQQGETAASLQLPQVAQQLSYGPESWPSMPITAARSTSYGQAGLGDFSGYSRPTPERRPLPFSYGAGAPSALDNSSLARGNPFRSSVAYSSQNAPLHAESMPHAYEDVSTTPPVGRGEHNWVSFDQQVSPVASIPGYSSIVGDPAHLRTDAMQCSSHAQLAPRR